MSMSTHEQINLNQLTASERIELVRRTYRKTSYFQELFVNESKEIDCAEHANAFREGMMRIFLEKKLICKPVELENLHHHVSDVMRAYDFDDGVNKISSYFYDADAQFMKVYYRFIEFLRFNFLKEPFYFQQTPTIRIHCPYGKNSNHYPRYHTDIGYGHPPEEINIWLPLTHVLSGHGFKVMSFENSKHILEKLNYDFSHFIHQAIHDKEFSDFCGSVAKNVTTEFGKMIAFDSRCIHSGEPLKVHTRISMDIRIIPLSKFKKMDITYQGSGRRKIIFAPGHCYHEHDSDFMLNYQGT